MKPSRSFNGKKNHLLNLNRRAFTLCGMMVGAAWEGNNNACTCGRCIDRLHGPRPGHTVTPKKPKVVVAPRDNPYAAGARLAFAAEYRARRYGPTNWHKGVSHAH